MAVTPSWALDGRRNTPAAVQASQEPIIRFFSYHDAHPVALTMVLMKEFGHEWIDWHPEALRKEIVTTFRATSVSDHNWQKLQAVRTLFSSTAFWAEWEVFEKIIQALNNNVPTFDVLQRCTISQLMAGVDMVLQLREEPFTDEVKRYVASCAIDAGVIYLPEPLDFAQTTLLQPQYECLDCGKVGDVDMGDARCDFCTSKFDQEHPLSGKAPAHVPAKTGTNLRTFTKRETGVVKSRFDAIKMKKEVELDENSSEDVQAAKLTIAFKYMQQRRAELVEQLEELKSWVTR